MKRADPVEMRQALQAVEAFSQAGVLFVPMPVVDPAEHGELVAQMLLRLDRLEAREK